MTKKNDEKLYRGYTVRLFPTPEQEELMWKHVHASRFIWNYMLDLQNGRYENGKKYLSGYSMCNELKYMKIQPEMGWLKDVAHATMQQICLLLDHAFKMFFAGIRKKPKYKKKNGQNAFFFINTDNKKVHFNENNTLHVPRIGDIKCSPISNIIGIKFTNPVIKYIKSSEKWMLKIKFTRDKQALLLSDKSMGIDFGVKELAVVAVGDKKLVFHNINKSKKMRQLEKKRKHIKRTISRKYRTFNVRGTPKKRQSWEKSKNIEKYEQMLREIDAKMANIRHNYIHQITRQLTDMLPERVVMEDINVRGLMKNRYLAKSISEQNFHFFIHTMKYKCEEYGIEFIQADRWFPSSKTCSDCGHIKRDLKLKDRTYICPVCGLEIDRDYNAAINLMNYTEKNQYDS